MNRQFFNPELALQVSALLWIRTDRRELLPLNPVWVETRAGRVELTGQTTVSMPSDIMMVVMVLRGCCSFLSLPLLQDPSDTRTFWTFNQTFVLQK